MKLACSEALAHWHEANKAGKQINGAHDVRGILVVYVNTTRQNEEAQCVVTLDGTCTANTSNKMYVDSRMTCRPAGKRTGPRGGRGACEPMRIHNTWFHEWNRVTPCVENRILQHFVVGIFTHCEKDRILDPVLFYPRILVVGIRIQRG